MSVSLETEIWYCVIEKSDPGPQDRLGPSLADIVPSITLGLNLFWVTVPPLLKLFEHEKPLNENPA